jgi:hypothetical protein
VPPATHFRRIAPKIRVIHTVVKMLALTQTKELNATGLERIRGGSPREGFLSLPP